MYPISVTGIPFTLQYQIECKYPHHDASTHQNLQCIYSNEFRLLLSVSLVLDLVFSTLSVAISATLVVTLTFLALGALLHGRFGLFELGLELAALGPLLPCYS
jgi:hypothetical protein